MPRMTFSLSPDHLWHLSVEVSFPAWQKGSNIELTNELEIPLYLYELTEYVCENICLEFNAFSATVSRIDVAEDIQVGEGNVTGIVKDISRTKLNRFIRTNINDETVYFKNRGKSQNVAITFYDKFKQACKEYPNSEDLEFARGILRQEVSLRSSKIEKVREELNLPNRTARVMLTREVADHILNYGKKTVHFDLSLKNERDWILEVTAKFPITKALHIIGFVMLLRRLGNNFYNLPAFKFNKRSYNRYLKQCIDNQIYPYE
jgi:hypothetical protein